MRFKSRFLTFSAKKIFISVTVNTFYTQLKESVAIGFHGELAGKLVGRNGEHGISPHAMFFIENY